MNETPAGLIQYGTSTSVYEDDDSNDFERNQDLYGEGPNDYMTDDSELFSPYDKPYRFENWPVEDLVSFVGGSYAKGNA